jgi:Ca2+-binding EF-hand superfamily protein
VTPAALPPAATGAGLSAPQPGTLVLPTQEETDQMFRRWDTSGNGILSLAEIDAAVQSRWPQFDHKPSLMRAYRAADVNNDGLIKRREFHLLFEYLVYFTDLSNVFDEIDSNHDRRLSHHEFVEGCERLGIKATEEELEQEFVAMDMRDGGGGFVLFDEFSIWCARRQIEWHHSRQDYPVIVTTATPPGVSQARDRLQAVLSDEHHPEAYDIEALRQAFAMYCESSCSIGKTKWMTSPKFMRMMRDSGVIRTRPKPDLGDKSAGGDKSGGPATWALVREFRSVFS